MDSKRRLPLVSSSADIDEPVRAAWQWVAFGVLAIVVVWLPTALLGLAVSSTGTAGGIATGRFALASVVGVAVATTAGGFLVGRWGGRSAGVREAALSGLVAACLAIAASASKFGLSPGELGVVLVATPFAALGGKWGHKRRTP